MLFINRTRKYIFRLIPAVAILAISLASCPTGAYAASFVHTHSDNCMGDVEKTCDNHVVERELLGERIYLCERCDAYSFGDVYTCYDVCQNGFIDRRTISKSAICQKCHDDVFASKIVNYPPHTYTERGLTCGFSDGEAIANVSMSLSTREWTNGDVTVMANVTGLNDSFSTTGILYDFGYGASQTSYIVVSSNGTYTVNVSCPGYGTVGETVQVSNIDKTAPHISIYKSTESWTESGLDVIVSASDDESGLADNAYSFNGEPYGSANTKHITGNGTVTVKVVDKAGNVSSGTITISNIGKNPASAESEKTEEKDKNEINSSVSTNTTVPNKRPGSLQQKDPVKPNNITSNNADSGTLAEIHTEKSDEKIEDESESKKSTGTFISSFIKKDKETELNNKRGISVTVSDSSKYLALNTSEKKPADIVKTSEKTELVNIQQEAEIAEDIVYEVVADDSSAMNSKENVQAYIIAGVLLLMLGLMAVIHFNYIYVRKNGKIKLVSAARARAEKELNIIMVRDKKLEEGEKYFIFTSPWMKLCHKRKGMAIEISFGDSKNKEMIFLDETMSFTY